MRFIGSLVDGLPKQAQNISVTDRTSDKESKSKMLKTIGGSFRDNSGFDLTS
jgi:hypothetical protein